MSTDQTSPLYSFIFKGLLAEEALDIAGRKTRLFPLQDEADAARTLSIDVLDDELVSAAKSMAPVYIAIAAFENSVRKLISSVLLEQIGENWWQTNVSEKITNRAESKRKEEERIKWHVQRGMDPIFYTQMGDLGSIIQQNWPLFEPYVPSVEWVNSILDVIERSRNVIMHSGILSRSDLERVGIYIRDWVKQVGA